MSLFLIAIGKMAYSKKVTQLLRAMISARAVEQLLREDLVSLRRLSFLFSLLFLIMLPLFIFLSMRFFQLNHWSVTNSFFTFSIYTLGIFIFYFLKILIYKFAGFIFEETKATSQYIFDYFLFNQAVGFILFPIIILWVFAPVVSHKFLFFTGVVSFSVIGCYRVIRGGLIIIAQYNFSKVYLFLYLCTLEILPLTVLLKLFARYI